MFYIYIVTIQDNYLIFLKKIGEGPLLPKPGAGKSWRHSQF